MDVSSEVKAAIAQGLRLPATQLDDGCGLVDLGAESIDVIELLFALEEKFDIDITLESAETDIAGAGVGRERNLSDLTVGDVCRAVQALVNAKRSEDLA